MEFKIEKKRLLYSLGLAFSLSVVLFNVLYFQFNLFWATALGSSAGFTVLIFGLIYANATIKCVVQISAIKLIGPQSRLVIISLITGLFLGGPIISIQHNLIEVLVTSKCVEQTVKQQAEDMKIVYTSAFHDISNTIANSVEVWKDLGKNINSIVTPVRNGLTMANKTVQDFEIKLKEVQSSCENEINKVRQKCDNDTGSAYKKCLESIEGTKQTVTDIGQKIGDQGKKVVETIKNPFSFLGKRKKRSPETICEPINIGQKSCSLFKTEFCAPLKGVKAPGLPQIYDSLTKLVKLFTLKIEPNYSLETKTNSTGQNLTQTFVDMKDDLLNKFSVIQKVFSVMQRLLTIPLLLVPLFSYLYLRKSKKLLDQGRKDAIDSFFSKDAKKEKRAVTNSAFVLATHIFLTVSIFSFDYLLYISQTALEQNGAANFTAEGNLEIKLDIESGPVFQPIIDTFITQLELTNSYEVQTSTENCLPRPTKSARIEIIVYVAVLYGVAMVSFIFQRFSGPIKKLVVLKFINDQK